MELQIADASADGKKQDAGKTTKTRKFATAIIDFISSSWVNCQIYSLIFNSLDNFTSLLILVRCY